MKPKLSINHSEVYGINTTLGLSYLIKGLVNSGLFDIEEHNDRLSVMRGERATIVYYNGKKVYVDFWEYTTPTHTLEAYNAKFDLIVKLQHDNLSLKSYNRYCNRKNIMKGLSDEEKSNYLSKIVPWTFFPSRMMEKFVENEKDLRQDIHPIESCCFFCGKEWKCRHKMLKSLKEQHIEYIASDQGLRFGRKIKVEDYLHKMLSSRYGLILNGRHTALTDCKNRREIDYMIMHKPLLLNYKPFYYDPLIEGKHYIYIDEKTIISSLADMYNTEEIEHNAYEWYKQNATPIGSANTFLRIMQEKFNE